jgi:flagellar biosynthesis chaperone FliJ
VQVEQFSTTLQKNKNTNENITKQWNEIEVKRKKQKMNLHTKKKTKVVIENYKCLQLTINTIWQQIVECLHIKNYDHFK